MTIREWLISVRERNIDLDLNAENELVTSHRWRADDLEFALEVGVDAIRDEFVIMRQEAAERPEVAARTPVPFANYQEAGFVKFPHPLEGWVWVHPDGDEQGQKILDGLVDFADAEHLAEQRAERRRREAHARHGSTGFEPDLPPLEDVEVRPGQHPGQFTYALRRDHRYRQFPT